LPALSAVDQGVEIQLPETFLPVCPDVTMRELSAANVSRAQVVNLRKSGS
jgi:hypothetical protein